MGGVSGAPKTTVSHSSDTIIAKVTMETGVTNSNLSYYKKKTLEERTIKRERKMALLTVHSIPLLKEYQSTAISRATLFTGVCWTLSVFIPLLVAYASHGFWFKYQKQWEKPNVAFQHNLLLVANSALNDRLITWSTFPEYNHLASSFLRRPNISVSLQSIFSGLFYFSSETPPKWLVEFLKKDPRRPSQLSQVRRFWEASKAGLKWFLQTWRILKNRIFFIFFSSFFGFKLSKNETVNLEEPLRLAE